MLLQRSFHQKESTNYRKKHAAQRHVYDLLNPEIFSDHSRNHRSYPAAKNLSNANDDSRSRANHGGRNRFGGNRAIQHHQTTDDAATGQKQGGRHLHVVEIQETDRS